MNTCKFSTFESIRIRFPPPPFPPPDHQREAEFSPTMTKECILTDAPWFESLSSLKYITDLKWKPYRRNDVFLVPFQLVYEFSYGALSLQERRQFKHGLLLQYLDKRSHYPRPQIPKAFMGVALPLNADTKVKFNSNACGLKFIIRSDRHLTSNEHNNFLTVNYILFIDFTAISERWRVEAWVGSCAVRCRPRICEARIAPSILHLRRHTHL